MNDIGNYNPSNKSPSNILVDTLIDKASTFFVNNMFLERSNRAYD